MNYLSAESIAKSYSERWLFRDISLGISQGEKIALVGNNGVGKSTLLRILSGELPPDNGKVSIRDGIRLGYLTQQPDVSSEVLVKDVLFHEDNNIARVVKEYEDCLHHPDIGAERMQNVVEQMDQLGAWDYDAKVQEITGRLGVGDVERPFGSLSGGQKKRLFLAQLLLGEPDLIILDEPTNHLDVGAIEWLEHYLSAQSITLIMVTHDRYFLDNVSNQIFELDRGNLYRHNGDYAYFVEKKTEREGILRAEVTKARNLLRKELEWMRRQPKARGTKAKYRIEAFHELKEKASADLSRERLELNISESRQGGKVLEIENVSSSFDDLPIVDKFSYVFKKRDRIGIVGNNGVGKSTFLDLLAGNRKPDSGEIIRGTTTKIGYFTQEPANLNPENRVIEEVKSIAEFITLADGSQVSASRFLESFLFPPEKQYNSVAKLSGGEKKRLQLLKVLMNNPNFLILDEPTNDFDIDTLNVLEDFLETFSGCLVLVSHDRYFMDHLVEQLFVFEGDGRIRIFNGNYTDYREWLDNREVEQKQNEASAEPASKTRGKKKLSFREKQEFERLQGEIDDLERERARVVEMLNRGEADHMQLHEWANNIGRLSALIDEKTLRWLELSDLGP